MVSYDRIGAIVRKNARVLALFLSLPREETERRQLTTSWEESPHQNPIMLAPDLRLSILQNCKKIDICC